MGRTIIELYKYDGWDIAGWEGSCCGDDGMTYIYYGINEEKEIIDNYSLKQVKEQGINIITLEQAKKLIEGKDEIERLEARVKELEARVKELEPAPVDNRFVFEGNILRGVPLHIGIGIAHPGDECKVLIPYFDYTWELIPNYYQGQNAVQLVKK